MALRILYGPLIARFLVARSARVKASLGEHQLLELEKKASHSDAGLHCGHVTPKYKDYYFDIPVYGDQLKHLAVQLVRDPRDPTLIIYEDAMWMHDSRTDKYITVPTDNEKQREPVLYRLLDDMVFLKKQERFLEFAHQKCEIPLARPNREEKRNSQRKRPSGRRSRGTGDGKHVGKLLAAIVGRVNDIEEKESTGRFGVARGAFAGSNRRSLGPGSNRIVSAASLRRHQQISRASLRGDESLRRLELRSSASLRGDGSSRRPEQRNSASLRVNGNVRGHELRSSASLRGDGSMRRHEQRSSASLRRNGSLKRKDSKRGSLKRHSLRKSAGTRAPESIGRSLIEAFSHSHKSRFETNATIQSGRPSTRGSASKSMGQHCVISMEINQTARIAKPNHRGPHGAAAVGGAAVGYMAPLWLAAESGVVMFPALGIVGGAAGGYVLARKLMTTGSKVGLLGADKLFEKLHCMSKANTCGGRPCFKECTDDMENLVLMPYDRKPDGYIRC